MPDMQDWLVVQIRPRWEKKVARLLAEKGIEIFCPLVKERRQWSDRIKTIDVPLLKAYVFVRIDETQRTSVRLTEGVINFLYKNGKPVLIKEKLIQQIREFHQTHPEAVAVEPDALSNFADTALRFCATKNCKTGVLIEALNIILVAGLFPSQLIEASTAKL
jgi:transcription antitermination factor NusG